MNDLQNIIKVKTTMGALHYYQFYPNETFLDLRHYLMNEYNYDGIIRFIYNDHDVDDNQLLSDCNEPKSFITCIIPSKGPTYIAKSLTPSIHHEYNTPQYSKRTELPPRPELQT